MTATFVTSIFWKYSLPGLAFSATAQLIPSISCDESDVEREWVRLRAARLRRTTFACRWIASSENGYRPG